MIGMIPEGLYLLTSVAMAVSAMKLAQQKVLVHDMSSIETLARVDVLCVDKTGTITEPGMEVQDLIPPGPAGHPGASGVSPGRPVQRHRAGKRHRAGHGGDVRPENRLEVPVPGPLQLPDQVVRRRL